MSHSIEQLIAIDLGNGTTSYIAGAGEIRGSFASLVAPAQSNQGLGGGFTRESFKTKFGSFYIGDDCREDGAAPVALTRAITVQKALRFCSSRS